MTLASVGSAGTEPSSSQRSRWAFNTKRPDAEKPPEIMRGLKWVSANTVPVSRLNDEAVRREVPEQISLKLDGKQAAARTVNRQRAVLDNALDYAVELKALTANRVSKVDCAENGSRDR
ncbi:hypothetical protein [Amycolatopsis pithecellobii]|uniref:Uncharacterized protein n=1 Tax=Amycolatopsis pithecellobii TaxID=664692 RepID=A0A6N7Z3L3_9PSEU|nr:hypothetical protein [Amycolatopsis pithecellobii]MTD56543.1 hypothetical protein [Amycolatopsis pithecellobii]